MANYYTNFSESIANLTPEEKVWVEKELTAPTEYKEYTSNGVVAAEAFLQQWLKDHPLTDEDEHEYWPNFSWSLEDGDLWIFADENGCVDHVGIFVRRFLARWRPDDVFSLTWADTCSSLRLGAFSGGWLVVSKNEIVHGNAYCEAEKAAQALRKGDFKA